MYSKLVLFRSILKKWPTSVHVPRSDSFTEKEEPIWDIVEACERIEDELENIDDTEYKELMQLSNWALSQTLYKVARENAELNGGQLLINCASYDDFVFFLDRNLSDPSWSELRPSVID